MSTPYGSWESPITTDLIVGETISLGGLTREGDCLVWSESRPAEGGRTVLVRRDAEGNTQDVTPPPFNVRTRVHEYGGGAFLIDDGQVYFSNFTDQRLYQQTLAPKIGQPESLTPEAPLRYADARKDAARNRLICVVEDHTDAGQEAVNSLSAVDLATGDVRQLVGGYDFFAAPRVSRDGKQLLWLCWNHPNMPWDGTELWCGRFDEAGGVAQARRVAGGPDESICTPDWSPTGKIVFISDRSGWWNLHEFEDGSDRPLLEMAAEFAGPAWLLGGSTFEFKNDQVLLCTYLSRGTSHLIELDLATGHWTPVETPFDSVSINHYADGKLSLSGASVTAISSIALLDLTTGDLEIVKQSSELKLDPGYLSRPEAIEFPTIGDRTAHAFFYPPANKDMTADPGERPPLLAMVHGGPTAATGAELSLLTQFWTSRGIAVVAINYGGSTGFGRDYRRRLNGRWGVVDVDDTEAAARYLIERDRVDGDRLAITGGSAGGYTTLAVLTFRDSFKAGASYYGVSDLEALANDTHKFESRYLDGLIGRYPADIEIYKARSPINHVDRLVCPVIFFQGADDRIVPPNQAEMMVAALDKQGLPVAYLLLEGERHGFRKAENIKRTLEAELYFYARIFGFDVAGDIEPVEIRNL